MDFHSLPRRELQTLCKRNKIPANMTNVAMADALRALPTVEGLEAFMQEAQECLSPQKAAAMLEAPFRSCRRSSTRKQPDPPRSSAPRTRRAAADRTGKTESAAENVDEVVIDFPGLGIPNSPTTLNSRGRRTRTLVTAGLPEGEDESVEAVKKLEPLPLEILKTPATRTRGRRAASQISKLNEEGVDKIEEDGAPVVAPTPLPTTARRASTRRGGSKAAPATEEAIVARSTHYRTRRTVMEEAAAAEAAVVTRNTAASRKDIKKGEGSKMRAAHAPLFGEDGTEGEDPAEEVTESPIPQAVPGGDSEDLTAEAPSESDGCDAIQVANAPIVAEVVSKEELVQMDGEAPSPANPTVMDEEDVPSEYSTDQTMEKNSIGSNDPTIENSLDPSDTTVQKNTMVGADEGHTDQTVVDELVLQIAEISLDPTADERDILIGAGSNDLTAEDGALPMEFLTGAMLIGVPMEGPVDPMTVHQVQVSVVETDAETPNPILSAEEVGIPDTAIVSPIAGVVTQVEPEKEEDATLSLAFSFDGTLVESGESGKEQKEETASALVAIYEPLAETDKASEFVEEISYEAPGIVTSPIAGVVSANCIKFLPQGTKKEVSETEEFPGLNSAIDEIIAERGESGEPVKKGKENLGLVPVDEHLTETEKAAVLVQTVGSDATSFLYGEQDKENAAIKACLSPPLKQQLHQAAVVYDHTTSLRKLKAAYKEVLEEQKKKRSALATLDDNCITSPIHLL